nr:trypsin 3A1-like isoform X2 [Onthophagus taurus]
MEIRKTIHNLQNIIRSKRNTFNEFGFNYDCDCKCGVTNRQMRVVNGEQSRPHEFPWLVGLYRRGEYYCGGALITSKHILTAAHCVKGFNVKDISVVLGDHDREETNRLSTIEVRNAKKMKPHERYDSNSFNNDIALIELDGNVEYGDKIQSICLPMTDSGDYSGLPGVVAGWGRLGENMDTSRTVKKAIVPIWAQSDCYNSGYGEQKLSENMFCAGYIDGKSDACRGDSGGPLNVKTPLGYTEVIGIVSWGRGCARPNLPGIYTKVINYLDWIGDNIKGECVCPPPQGKRGQF